MLNIMLIILAIATFVFVVYFFVNADKKQSDDDFFDDEGERLTIEKLTSYVAEIFSSRLQSSIDDAVLSQDAFKARELDNADLRRAMDEAPMGDNKARKSLKNRIANIFVSKRPFVIDGMKIYLGLSEKDMDNLVPFNAPDKLTPLQMHEIIMHLYGKVYGENGFNEFMQEFFIEKDEAGGKKFKCVITGHDGKKYYKVTKQMIKDAYNTIMNGESPLGDVKLKASDKRDIITQLIFERKYGLGCIDTIYHMALDEIECGVSGIPVGSFEMATVNNGGEILYSYQSVWIVFGGVNIQLEYLGFENEEDFERVSDNIYRYNAGIPLSQKEGAIVSTMPDGSRIEVDRPSFGENWAFFLRKFSASSAIAPVKLVRESNNWVPLIFMQWVFRGEQSTVITGGTGTGKSTMLKTFIRYIDSTFNLRIYEIASELNLRFVYPLRNIYSMQTTSTISMRKAQNFGKKMNPDVTIIGEMADSEQACEYLDSCRVNSKFGLATHHATTAEKLVAALADDEIKEGRYKDKSDAIADVASVLNINCHLENDGGWRHIGHITEILPYSDIAFPSETPEYEDASDEVKTNADARKFYKDSINPRKFITKQLCHWVDTKERGKHFILDDPEHPVSDRFRNDIKKKLADPNAIVEFDNDMEMLSRCYKKWDKGEEFDRLEAAWVEKVLSA